MMIAHRSIHVLIVEDQPNVSKALALRLRAAGHRASMALDGVSGVIAAFKWQPDVITLDLNLPDHDGFEVMRRLKASPASGIPVIFLTSSESDLNRRAAMDAGACEYFCKPYDAAELITAMETAAIAATPIQSDSRRTHS